MIGKSLKYSSENINVSLLKAPSVVTLTPCYEFLCSGPVPKCPSRHKKLIAWVLLRLFHTDFGFSFRTTLSFNLKARFFLATWLFFTCSSYLMLKHLSQLLLLEQLQTLKLRSIIFKCFSCFFVFYLCMCLRQECGVSAPAVLGFHSERPCSFLPVGNYAAGKRP